ncbi:hypothetical protein TNCV_2551081 [Trichonephila clavipes]|nr:hypothetical protein TNCV_2551081 [Trichonephila clavipes]
MIAICMGTAGGFDEEYCGQMMVVSPIVGQLSPAGPFSDAIVSISTAMQDNMLTKYRMIKFIDFCEVWFLPESVTRVATIVGENRCHTPRH